MNFSIMKALLIATCFVVATGFKVVENSHSPLQPRVGETMTLKCKTSSWFETCIWTHNGQSCDFHWKKSHWGVKYQPCTSFHRHIQFIGTYDTHLCEIKLDNITKQDGGNWSCEMESTPEKNLTDKSYIDVYIYDLNEEIDNPENVTEVGSSTKRGIKSIQLTSSTFKSSLTTNSLQSTASPDTSSKTVPKLVTTTHLETTSKNGRTDEERLLSEKITESNDEIHTKINHKVTTLDLHEIPTKLSTHELESTSGRVPSFSSDSGESGTLNKDKIGKHHETSINPDLTVKQSNPIANLEISSDPVKIEASSHTTSYDEDVITQPATLKSLYSHEDANSSFEHTESSISVIALITQHQTDSLTSKKFVTTATNLDDLMIHEATPLEPISNHDLISHASRITESFKDDFSNSDETFHSQANQEDLGFDKTMSTSTPNTFILGDDSHSLNGLIDHVSTRKAGIGNRFVDDYSQDPEETFHSKIPHESLRSDRPIRTFTKKSLDSRDFYSSTHDSIDHTSAKPVRITKSFEDGLSDPEDTVHSQTHHEDLKSDKTIGTSTITTFDLRDDSYSSHDLIDHASTKKARITESFEDDLAVLEDGIHFQPHQEGLRSNRPISTLSSMEISSSTKKPIRITESFFVYDFVDPEEAIHSQTHHDGSRFDKSMRTRDSFHSSHDLIGHASTKKVSTANSFEDFEDVFAVLEETKDFKTHHGKSLRTSSTNAFESEDSISTIKVNTPSPTTPNNLHSVETTNEGFHYSEKNKSGHSEAMKGFGKAVVDLLVNFYDFGESPTDLELTNKVEGTDSSSSHPEPQPKYVERHHTHIAKANHNISEPTDLAHADDKHHEADGTVVGISLGIISLILLGLVIAAAVITKRRRKSYQLNGNKDKEETTVEVCTMFNRGNVDGSASPAQDFTLYRTWF